MFSNCYSRNYFILRFAINQKMAQRRFEGKCFKWKFWTNRMESLKIFYELTDTKKNFILILKSNSSKSRLMELDSLQGKNTTKKEISRIPVKFLLLAKLPIKHSCQSNRQFSKTFTLESSLASRAIFRNWNQAINKLIKIFFNFFWIISFFYE